MKRSEFEASAAAHFRSLFNINKLASSKHIFARMIQTDCFSVCVHFTCPKRTAGDPVEDLSGQRVIAIDQGRVNIVHTEEKLAEDSFRCYKLTRGRYYEACGMKRRIRKTAKWEQTISAEQLLYSEHSPKMAKDSGSTN